LNALLAECLKRGSGELRLFENNDEIILRHCSNSLLLSVQLTPLRPDKSLLLSWLRLGEVSLEHFPGALAQAPASGALWLMHCLHDKHDEQQLQLCLESPAQPTRYLARHRRAPPQTGASTQPHLPTFVAVLIREASMHNKIHKRDSLRIDPPETSSRRADWRCLMALTCLLAPAPGALAAIPAEWKNTAYAYEAQHKPLREVLEDFAQTFGTQLQIEGLLEGNVNGKIRANTPQSLLDRLGVEHRFQCISTTTPCTSAPLISKSPHALEVSSETIADLKQALTDIGLLDSRFGWGELPEDGVVLVSGPRRYIEQIKQFSSQRRSPDEKQSVLSYPLKFANAADRQMEYRNERITIPGVATMLRGAARPTQSRDARRHDSALPPRSPSPRP
jgi:hypothetical protein